MACLKDLKAGVGLDYIPVGAIAVIIPRRSADDLYLDVASTFVVDANTLDVSSFRLMLSTISRLASYTSNDKLPAKIKNIIREQMAIYSLQRVSGMFTAVINSIKKLTALP